MPTNRISVERRYEAALVEAKRKLASLDVIRGRPVDIKGLSGWLFEQTIRTCLETELEFKGISVPIEEQVSIGGRARVDLVVGRVAIEIKAAGFFGNEGHRYREYRTRIESKGWHYLYLTMHETHWPYVGIARRAFGAKKAFFLDQRGAWPRFIATVCSLCAED
jgi:hypothetical protein